MAKKKNIEKDKPKEDKPQFEVKGFVLSIPIEELDRMLRDMSKPKTKKNKSRKNR